MAKQPMTREQALKELEDCATMDEECGHSWADQVLCELLRSLGYDDVVDAFEKLNKWYA